MSRIKVEHVYKIFGPRPESVLPLLDEDTDKASILEETGHTIGLSDINMTIEHGEFFVVMGLSGSGKSTLIRHFNRLIEPTSGRILFDEENVMSMSRSQLRHLRQHHVSMVFQRFALMPHKTVIDNVAFGLEIQKVPEKIRREKAAEWIETVGLQGYEYTYPSRLSGGMQQRVGLARALCINPHVLLMDEPFSALDPLHRTSMQEQIVMLQEKLDTTIVFITHDLEEALNLGQRIAVLKDGSVSQIGTPADILLNPANSYIEEFISSFNRARIISVTRVMRPAQIIIEQGTAAAALRDMEESSSDFGYLVINGSYLGILSRRTLRQLSPDDLQKDISAFAHNTPDSFVPPHATIEHAVSQALKHDHPLPVVDTTHNKLLGILHRDDIVRMFNA